MEMRHRERERTAVAPAVGNKRLKRKEEEKWMEGAREKKREGVGPGRNI